MEKGLVHIYCGDGKGKTTAAVGLAVRCAGCGGRVLYTSFLKDNKSGELNILRATPNIKLIENPQTMKFIKLMSEDEKSELRALYKDRFTEIVKLVNSGFDMLVIDEIIPAINNGVVDEKELIDLIDNRPFGTELVMTGRKPSINLLVRADYISEIKKIKHPFDRGIAARKMIEM